MAKPTSKDPAIPRSMVTKQPLGSFSVPGVNAFAKIPASSPITIHQITFTLGVTERRVLGFQFCVYRQ